MRTSANIALCGRLRVEKRSQLREHHPQIKATVASTENGGLQRDENEGDEGLPRATCTRARRRFRANNSVLILFAPLSCAGIILTDRRGRDNLLFGPPLGFTGYPHPVRGIYARSPNQFRFSASLSHFPTRSIPRPFSLPPRYLNKSYKYDRARSPSFAERATNERRRGVIHSPF